jgi:hypothetical protein
MGFGALRSLQPPSADADAVLSPPKIRANIFGQLRSAANNKNPIAIAGVDCGEMPAFAPRRRLSLQFSKLSNIDQ